MVESEYKIEYSEELLKLIDEVVRENPGIGFKVCSKCGKELPIHKYFYSKNMVYKDKLEKKCKICNGRNGYGHGNNHAKRNQKLFDNLTEDKLIQLYEEYIINNLKELPKNIFKNELHVITLLRYLFLHKLNFTKKDFSKISYTKILTQHKLSTILKYHRSFEILLKAIPEFNFKRWELFDIPDHYWDDNSHVDEAIEWLVEQLKNDNIINTINDLKFVLSRNLLIKYNLFSLQRRRFNSSIYNILIYIFKEELNPWELKNIKVPSHYFCDTNNRNRAINWLINKLNIIERKDLLKITGNDFYNNGLSGLFQTYYNSSVYMFITENFKHLNIKEWEMDYVPTKFFKNKETRIKSIKEFVELRFNNTKEILNELSLTYLLYNYPKFARVLIIYYKCNIFNMFNDVYPNIFKPEDFNKIAKDGILCDSKEEMIVHNYIIDNYNNNNIIHCGRSKKYIISDIKNNVKYIPDWIINDNIIIEYFGLFYPDKTEKVFIDYVIKTNQKIKFYNKYCDENNKIFIALFPCDLKNNLKGVRDKLNI